MIKIVTLRMKEKLAVGIPAAFPFIREILADLEKDKLEKTGV